MKWFGSGDKKISHRNFQEKDKALSGKDITEERSVSHQSSKFVYPPLFSPSSHEALIDGKIAGTGDAEIADRVEKNGESADLMKVNPNQLEIFSEESFWNELESFIGTPQGSAVFSLSRTSVKLLRIILHTAASLNGSLCFNGPISLKRDHLVQILQKQGPPILRSLSKNDLLHLVDLLISDKKWLEERDSRTYPFRLTYLDGKDPRNNPPINSNGLSQIFSGKHPSSPESGERKHQNPPHTGVPQPVVHRGSSSNTRSELLADCQKLVDHIVKEYPEGFNLGSFRKLFLERNGYALDLQKLGYEKLVNLLQIMPGVRIESNLIFPAGAFKSLDLQKPDPPIQGSSSVGPVVDSNRESSALSAKGDDSDSPWDELGPVDNSGSEKEKIDPRLTRKGKKGKLPDYEPLREDDFSDSEDETSSGRSENEGKSKLEEESSLLQILDIWYSGKGGDSKKDETDKAEVVPKPSAQIGSGTKDETPVVGPTRKHKPGKSYSFVTEQPADSKDKLVDGILGSLKKSGERSADSRVLG
ncbi:hypothetical protein DH2020_015501 [Rehmannia glutinosa]|uniref:HTH OST-type domain-containing protein n=1 Tax=Rehmannia glutinosa TaxID=99300 RepID=A0ABR0WWD2_REHGL